MYVYVKIPTDTKPLRFGPDRHAMKFPDILVVFCTSTGQAIVTFTEYKSYWEESEDDKSPNFKLIQSV